MKEDDDVKKYFLPSNPQNLRNRFANDIDQSAILLEIKDDSSTKIIEISNTVIETNTEGDNTVNRIIAGSDFITYKYLSKIYDFRNSEEIDLFEWFEKEVLMFVNFEESYKDHSGNLTSETYASDWWDFIREAPNVLPYNKNLVSVSSDEYKRLKNETIPKFIDNLKVFLAKITSKFIFGKRF